MRCDHWSFEGFCGAEGVRLYLTGLRCSDHTPAALAGRQEPSGQDEGPLPGAKPFHFNKSVTTRKKP